MTEIVSPTRGVSEVKSNHVFFNELKQTENENEKAMAYIISDDVMILESQTLTQ